jgi:hypothetical protein
LRALGIGVKLVKPEAVNISFEVKFIDDDACVTGLAGLSSTA